jgi:hypothetical protein
MTTEPRLTARPRENIGPLNKRPARGTQDGQLYTSEYGLSSWDNEAGVWRGGAGGISIRFLVGPVGSGAPYNTFTAAIAAAVVAGGSQTVPYLSGSYAEDFTVPANISILPVGASNYTAFLAGMITLNGASGVQMIQGLRITGAVFCFGASTAEVALKDVLITHDQGVTRPGGAFSQIGDGWAIRADDCSFDGGAAKRGMEFDSSVDLVATDCDWRAAVGHDPLRVDGGSGGTMLLIRPTVRGQIRFTNNAAVTLEVTDTTITALNNASAVIDGGVVGSTLKVHGWFSATGRHGDGTLYGAGTVSSIDAGTNIGVYHVARLPAALGNSDGANAFCDNLAGAPPDVQVPVYYGNAEWRRFTDNAVAV